ncbi:MAG: hypothetical protein ACOC5G_00500 [Acidobacteriota bacterium]
MKKIRPLNLNLAENPLRNRKLFHAFFFFLGGLFVLLLFISLITFYQYRIKNQNIRSAITRIENKITHAKREERRYLTQIESLSKANLAQVNFTNHLISKKVFSWTGLFTALEKSLPEGCCIVSISPLQRGDSPTEIKIEVASAGLDSLLEFINDLYAMNFSDFKLLREGRDKTGQLISEISLKYNETY